MTSTDDFLAHYGVMGMKWGVRKPRRSDVKKRNKTARNEFYKKRMERAAEIARKDPNSLIKTQTRRYDGSAQNLIMSGSEFTQYLLTGGVINSKYTAVYAQMKKDGQYHQDSEFYDTYKNIKYKDVIRDWKKENEK